MHLFETKFEAVEWKSFSVVSGWPSVDRVSDKVHFQYRKNFYKKQL